MKGQVKEKGKGRGKEVAVVPGVRVAVAVVGLRPPRY